MFSPLLFLSPNNEGWAFPALPTGEHEIGWLDEFGNENITLTAKGSNNPVYYEVDTELERADVFALSRICKISLPYDLGYEMNFDTTLLDYLECIMWRDYIAFLKHCGRYSEFYRKRGRF